MMDARRLRVFLIGTMKKADDREQNRKAGNY